MRKAVVASIVGVGLLEASTAQFEPVNLVELTQ